MRASDLIGALSVLGLVLAAATPARAQWSVSMSVESDRFWGGSLENAPEQKSFRPYRPTVIGGGVERRMGNAGFGLRVRYADAGVGLEGSDAVVVAKKIFTVVGLIPEVSYQIATLGPGNRLLLHAGPLIEFWHPIDEEWRTRVGGQAAVSLLVPLGGHFSLSVGGNLAVISSPFHSDELPGQYELRDLWRRGFVGGLQYRL
jgi:hypothetical protein